MTIARYLCNSWTSCPTRKRRFYYVMVWYWRYGTFCHTGTSLVGWRSESYCHFFSEKHNVPVCHRATTDQCRTRTKDFKLTVEDRQGQCKAVKDNMPSFLQNFVIWLSENFYISAVKWRVILYAATVCRLGSQRSPSLSSWIWVGDPGTVKVRERKDRKGKEREGGKMEKRGGSRRGKRRRFHTGTSFSHF